MIVLGLCAIVIIALFLALYSMSLDNDELRYENQHLSVELGSLMNQNQLLAADVERLLDDVTKLASEARHRDSHGRFVKK